MRKVLLATMVALALAAVPAAVAAPPTAIPVPASVIAAHPGGQAVFPTVGTVPSSTATVSPNAVDKITCWYAFFTGDNGGIWGTEQEHINPNWCGNGKVMRGVDNSGHYENCSLFVTCAGESSVSNWYGCVSGCASLGQQITGHFKVNVGYVITVDETVEYELYGNGQYWYYAYHD